MFPLIVIILGNCSIVRLYLSTQDLPRLQVGYCRVCKGFPRFFALQDGLDAKNYSLVHGMLNSTVVFWEYPSVLLLTRLKFSLFQAWAQHYPSPAQFCPGQIVQELGPSVFSIMKGPREQYAATFMSFIYRYSQSILGPWRQKLFPELLGYIQSFVLLGMSAV
ncbi:uncharacterized protein LOC123197473 [Mangifera indica]|uniref:uncharacterized protein LOC123197473 n=1 Tax=Mangifera indica TaxID=29780 RepID=UPI001CFAD464|nr:uncharacterized protein LOC123197473 [Mangifera indica]